MNKAKNPGRPALPKEKQRNCRITVRFTQEEFENIEKNSEGRSIGEFIREIVLNSGNLLQSAELTQKELSELTECVAKNVAHAVMNEYRKVHLSKQS